MSNEEATSLLTQHAIARAFAGGLCLAPPSREAGLMQHAPFALLPRRVRTWRQRQTHQARECAQLRPEVVCSLITTEPNLPRSM